LRLARASLARANPVNRSEEGSVKTRRYGQRLADPARSSVLWEVLIALFADRGRVGA